MSASPSNEIPVKRSTYYGCALGLFVIALILFASMWNPFSNSHRYGPKTRLMNAKHRAEGLLSTVQVYASDHDGKFPPELYVVVEEGYISQDFFDHLCLNVFVSSSQPLPWIYLPDLNDKLPSDYPILLTPVLVGTRSWLQQITDYFSMTAPIFPAKQTRIVATVNGEAKIMSEDDVQALLKKYGVTLPSPTPLKKN